MLVRLIGTVYNRTIAKKYTEKYIHTKYGKYIPANHNLTDAETLRLSYDIVSDLVKVKHKDLCKQIKRTFSIDIEKYIRGYHIVNMLNEKNANGKIYTLIPSKDLLSSTKHRFEHRHILKIQDNRKHLGLALEYETHMQHMFNKCKLAPKIIKEYHIALPKGRRRVSVVIMDKYRDATVKYMLDNRNVSKSDLDALYNEIVAILNTMCKHNLIHGDLHWDNIGIEFDEKLKKTLRYKFSLLDFGQSTKGKCDLRVEILQLLRTLFLFNFKQSTIDYLENKLYKLYKSLFKERLDKKYSGPYGYDKMSGKYWSMYINDIHNVHEKQYAKKIHIHT